jgi:ABC-type transporter Mla subunit MlaD
MTGGRLAKEDRVANEPGTGSGVTAGLGGVGDMVRESVRAHARAVEMTQDWLEGALSTLKDQAESVGALLRSVDASLRATEQVVKSQAEATAAMAENLRASREVVDSAMAAHRHTVEGLETYVSGTLETLTRQVQAVRSQVEAGQRAFSDPVAAQSAAFLQLTRDWAEAYQRLTGAATGSKPKAD